MGLQPDHPSMLQSAGEGAFLQKVAPPSPGTPEGPGEGGGGEHSVFSGLEAQKARNIPKAGPWLRLEHRLPCGDEGRGWRGR